MSIPESPLGPDLIGEVAHYVSHGTPLRPDGTQAYPAQCRAATITEVTPGGEMVGLAVVNPTGLFFRSLADGGNVFDADITAAGTWHWPGSGCRNR